MTIPGYRESHQRLGERRSNSKVGEHMVKVDINKLMKYPSRASKEFGVIDLCDDKDINAYKEEVMTIKEEANFEELPLDKRPSELNTLPSRLKYSFLDTEQPNR